ncbi:MAG: autotransporter outer membrane beta-barrel domain-containing protein [Hyphomicrobiales bacterium]|nr:autotransporter outer membrane beta-barrel domain-containing protein [Hyphomicrobiales bacterium]
MNRWALRNSPSSFQTTLGVRLTSRIAMGNYGTLIPEVRLGWNHEFLDASQKITAALVGVPGSGFSATGIAFGRDAALIGAGLSMELSPDAKVFVDYDGRFASRLQEAFDIGWVEGAVLSDGAGITVTVHLIHGNAYPHYTNDHHVN